MHKLQQYGFRGNSHMLLQSFLSNRKQYVSLNGYDSEILELKCGIPQGSTLGPLLFLLYINDLRFCLKNSKASHFADDTCITNANRNCKALERSLNQDLKNVENWLNANRLSLNVKKTKLLIFHSKRKKIEQNSVSIKLSGNLLTPVENVKYLGMSIDNNLSWDAHVYNLSKKLGRANGILAKLRHYVPLKNRVSVYYAIFHSQILYGCTAWSLSTLKNINSINVLQKKCIRIMNFAPYNSHTNELFHKNQIIKLNDIIKIEQIKLAFLFKLNLLPDDLMGLFHNNENIYNTRNMVHGGIKVPKIKTVSYGDRTIRFNVPTQWNAFIKENDYSTFRNINHLKYYLKKYTLNSYKAL